MAPKKKGSFVKHTPNNQWFKNAVRSMGLAGADLIKDMVPAIYETGSSLYTVSKEARTALSSTSTRNLAKSISNMIENNTYTRMARNSVTNALSDLKTGKLYNKERMDKALEAELGLGDFDLDDIMSGSGDVDFGDISDESVDVTINNNNVIGQSPEATAVMTSVISDGLAQNANATLIASKAQTDTMIAVTSNAIASMQSTGDAIIRKLDSIDSNLSNLVTYMNDNVTKFIEASSKYYETMSSAQRADTSPGSTTVEGSVSPFSDHGGIDFKNLAKYMVENAKKMANESSVGALASMLTLSPSMIENGLIPALMKGGMKSVIPKVLQNSMSNIESIFQGFGETLLSRVADLSTNNNPILAAAGKILGYKPKSKTGYDLTKFERGAIPFDGMTKHSIVEIIPRELRKIQEILSGKEAKIFDWTTGRYASPEEIRKTNRNLVRQEGITAMETSAFGNKMRERSSLLSNAQDQEKFSKMLDTFYDNITKFEGYFDPNKRDSIAAMLPNMEKEFGQAMSDFFVKAVQTAGEAAHMSINPAKNKGVRNRRRMMETMEANPYEYNLFATEMDQEPVPMMNVTGNARNRVSRNIRNRLFGTPPSTSGSVSGATASSVARTPRASRSTRFRGQRTHRTNRTALAGGPSSDDGGPYLSGSIENYDADEIERRMRQQDQMNADIAAMSQKSSILNAPAGRLSSGLDKASNLMYKFAFGSGQDVANEILTRIGNALTGLADKIDENILQPLKHSLVGETDQDGFSRGGVFSNLLNSSKDFMNSVWSKFNGKSYKTSTGETIEGKPEESIMGSLRKNLKTMKDETLNFVFGKKNAETGKREGGQGFLAKAKDSITESLNKWSEMLFGKKKDSDGKEIATELSKELKERAPKALATGIAGAGLGLLNGMGTFGLLGNLILPGGPIGGAIVGSALGMLNQSEKFKDWLFGKTDDNGERTGGIISKQMQDFVKSNKTEIIGGAALGTMKSMLLGGSGVLSSIVGGPMAGALMGTAFALIKKSDAFQTLLYGKGQPGDPDYKEGIITKFKEKMQTKDGKNRFGLVGTGAVGGAMAAGIVGNMGILGAALTPAGPIGGAIMGAGMGIAMASDKFRSLVFGDLDEDTGKRQGGLVQKFQSYVSTELFTPAKLFMKGVALDTKDFIKDKMIEPLQMALDPIVEEFKYIGSRVREKVTEVATKITTSVKEVVLQPLGSALNKYLVDPLKKVGSTIFNAVFGVAKAILGAPFKAIGAFGNALVGRQTDRAARNEEAAIWNDPNRGIFSKVKDTFILNASSRRRREVAEGQYEWMQGRDERAAERREQRLQERYSDRYSLETERMRAFDERYRTRAKGYDITSNAGLEALSRNDRRKVQREQERRRKEGQKIDRLNAGRLRRGLPLLKNPYAQDGIFYDVKSGAQHKKWLEKENSKRKARGEPTLNDPFTGEKGSGGAIATTGAGTSSGSTVASTSSNETAASRRRIRRNADGSISRVPEESTVSEVSTVAETSSVESASTSSTSTSATTASTARRRAGAEAKATAADQKRTNGYIKDIRDEVNGQLNGVGSNINKIKRMLARALGVKDPDKDTGGDNKEYQSFADRFFNFMARPLHGITKMIATPFRVVAGIASSVKDAVGGAIQKVKELPGKIVEGFVGIAKGIGTAVGGLVRGVFSAGAEVIKGVWKGLGAAGNAMLRGFTGLVTGAASALGTVISGVADVGTAVLNGAVQVVSTLPTLMASTAEALGSIARTGMSLISSAFHTVRTAITETAGLIKDTVIGAGKAIWHGLTGLIGGIGSAAGFIGDKLGIGGANRKPKVRYAGEIQRVIDPIAVTNADKALRVIIEDFDNPVDLSSHTIHELRGYDDKGETVDSFSEFFGIDSTSGSGGSGNKFASILKGLGIGVLGGAAGAAAGFFAGKKSGLEGSLEEGTSNALESNSAVKTPGAAAVKNRRFRVAGVAGGIGALVGRQFDPEEAAEDREDAELQKQKVAENTRKDADYMKGLIAEADAAAEEREMRQRMVSGIEKISTEQKSHNSIWDSIFSKKGLITGGLLMLAPIILKFLNKFLGLDLGSILSNIGTSVGNVLSNWSFGIQNTDTAQEASEQKEEYADLLSGESGIGGFILPDGEHDATSDSRLKMFTKPIERGIHFAKEGIIKAGKISSQGVGGAFAKTTMSDRMAAGQIMVEKIKGAPNAIKNAAQRVVAPGTLGEDIALRGMYAADAVKNKASEVATKVSNSRVGQAAAKGAQKAGQAVTDTLTKLADSSVGKTVTGAAKGVASKITSAFDTFVSFMEKKIPSVAGKLSSVIKPIAEKIIGDNTLLGKIGAKISAKVGAKGGLAAVTLGASEIVWAVIGAVDGATSASNMFACEKDAVDWKMIVISSAMKAALQTTVGTIFDIVDSILWATMGVSLVRSLAQIIYGVMASEEDVNALAASQQRVQEDYLAQVNEEKQAAYEEYVQNLEDPTTALTFEQWDAEYGDQVDVTSFADYNDERNKTMFGKAADAVGKVGSAIKSGASSLWNGAKNIAGKAGNAIGSVVSGIGGGIKTAASAIGGGLKTAAGAVGNAAGAAWDKVKGVGSAISEKVNSITEKVGPVVTDVVRTFSNAGKKIGGIIGDKVKEITAPIGEAFTNVKNAIGEKLGQFGSWVGEKWEGVKEGVSTLVSNAGTAIGNAAQAFWDNTEPIREAASTAITKVKDGLGWVGNKVKEGADAIADKAGQMWDKLGGMWDDLKTNVGDFASKVKDNFQKGIDNLNSTVGSIFGFTDENGNPVSFTDGIKSGVKSLATTISTKIGNVGIGIQNLWTRFSNWANDENEPLREYVGSGRGRGRSRGYRSLGFGRGSDVYNQLDAKWNTADPSMKLNGCGPTVAAMIANRYGRGLPSYANPLEANAMSYDLGMRDIDGGTNPAFFEQYGASKGISMKEGPVDKNLIGNNLAGNRPIALMGKGGAFGPGMHYLMADGIHGNNVSIVDPYGGTRKTSSLDNLVRNTSSAIYSGVSGLGRAVRRFFGRGANQKNNKLDNNKLGNRLDKEKLAQEGARHGKVIAGGKGHWRIPPIGRFGRGTAKEQAAKVMQVAQGEVGYLEKATNASLSDKKANAGNNNWTKYGEWFGLNGGSKAPWCAMFVSWCLAQAGVSTSIAPKTAAVNEFYNFFKNKGTYHGKNEGYVPQTGDIIIMGGPSTHVGLVYSSDGQNVTTIEGNTSGQGGEDEGNGVYMKTYSMSDSWVYGFGTPAYDGQEVAFSGSSTSSGDSTVADTGVSGNFFDKLSAGMSEIGNRLLEGVTTGTYNTDFSSFFSSGSSSSSSSSGSSMSSGGEFPKYTDLSDEQKKFIAGVASAEQDSSDISAQRLEISQMANLNEVEYKKGTTGADLVSTLKGGWYAQNSLNKANNGQYSPEALQAVEEVLVQGKRTLPRHVTEHDFYGDITNIDLNPSTSAGKENRRKIKQGDLIKNSMGSQYYFYKFAGKDGPEGSGDPFGSKPQYANQYQNDKPWGGGRFGRGRSTVGTVAHGRSSKSNTAYLEHAYRKSVFGRGVDDAYTNQIMQQAIINYLKVIAENTGSTVDAINGIEIPASSSSGIIYEGKTTNNVTVSKPTKTSGNSQSTQKMSRNEQIARAIARGTT